MDLREAREGALRHPWEVARFRFFGEVLRKGGLLDRPARVLDVGAGDAWFARQLFARLHRGSELVCWDTGYVDGAGAEDAGLKFVRERPPGQRDLLLLLDVLEHVDDDAAFLRTLVDENTHSESHVLVSVPAWQALFTSHDTFLHHFRRYSPAQARALLARGGLRIVREGGLFHSLLLPRALSKVVEEVSDRLLGRKPTQTPVEWNGGPMLTNAVATALAGDNALSHMLARRGLSVPGLSWWALCAR